MDTEVVYDLCVIGAGMFGSAAARHASANPALKVCLIGPNEPTADERSQREIFGAHYDEGRITRVLDDAPACQVLSKHSIGRYKELEKLSGINFHTPVGCLFVGRKTGDYILKLTENATTSNVPLVDLDKEIFQKRYPYFNLKEDEMAILDDNGGGHISPRKMVEAQKKVAELQGCHIIESVVSDVEIVINGVHRIITETGGSVKAKRVLIATGAFTNMKQFSILNTLAIKRRNTEAVLLNITEDEAIRLSSMPAVIIKKEETSSSDEFAVYILPPIQYPNGKYYLKFGHSESFVDDLKTLEEMKNWYLFEGDKSGLKDKANFMYERLTGLQFSDIDRMTCVTCYSPSGLPYIDRISPTVTVALVGNGKGAKFSDEVGRIAAHFSVTGQWDSELQQNLFKATFQQD